jgi:hypothetical protein
LLQTANFGVPAFSGGVLVQLVFSFALQGFSVAFILWLQQGHRFSPIHAGLTLIPFSVGAILSAPNPNAGNLALKYGRRVLVTGAVLMAAGMVGVAFPAPLRWSPISSWDTAPGLLVAGIGLGLLVVPLVNVVLAASPHVAPVGRPASSAPHNSPAARSVSPSSARCSLAGCWLTVTTPHFGPPSRGSSALTQSAPDCASCCRGPPSPTKR